MSNINRIMITGNLTADPELRDVGDTQVLRLRVACNTYSRKAENNQRANYFNVNVWGDRASGLYDLLSKGQHVSVEGKMLWSEYQKEGESSKRQSYDINADEVEPGRRPGNGNGNGNGAPKEESQEATKDEKEPVATGDDSGLPF